MDIPKVHDYQEREGSEFFQALAKCEDFKIFECKVIQDLIDFKYPLALEYTLKMNFLPFLTWQVTLVIYLNYVVNLAEQYPDSNQVYLTVCIFHGLLAFFSLYFLSQELK